MHLMNILHLIPSTPTKQNLHKVFIDKQCTKITPNKELLTSYNHVIQLQKEQTENKPQAEDTCHPLPTSGHS